MSFLCNIGEQGIMAFWRIPQVVGKLLKPASSFSKIPSGSSLPCRQA
jgi:hypothetical protein